MGHSGKVSPRRAEQQRSEGQGAQQVTLPSVTPGRELKVGDLLKRGNLGHGVVSLAMSLEETAPPAVHFSQFLLEGRKMGFVSQQAFAPR